MLSPKHQKNICAVLGNSHSSSEIYQKLIKEQNLIPLAVVLKQSLHDKNGFNAAQANRGGAIKLPPPSRSCATLRKALGNRMQMGNPGEEKQYCEQGLFFLKTAKFLRKKEQKQHFFTQLKNILLHFCLWICLW